MPALVEPPRSIPLNGKRPKAAPFDHAAAEAPPAVHTDATSEQADVGGDDIVEQLVFDYLMFSLPLPALARRHSLTLTQLADLLESEPVQTLLRRMTRLAAQRARVVAVGNRASAIASLEATMATTDNPETARKAAATIIRTSDRVLYPTRRRRKAEQVTQETDTERTESTPTGDPAAPDTRATPSEAAQSAATENSPTSIPDSSSAPPRLCGERLSPPSEPRLRRSSSGAG